MFDFCKDHFRDLHFGLKLISGNTGQTEFELDKSFAENPDTALSQRVVASYNEKKSDSSRLGFRNSDFEIPNKLLVHLRYQIPHRC